MAVSKTFQFQSHAVSRTDELLSCAKTAFRIAASSKNTTTTTSTSSYTSLDSIQLHNPSFQPQPISDLLEEGLTLLRSMDHDVSTLQTLAKRRGQTNDPTKEIAVLTARLEQDTQELQEFTSQRLLRQPCATKSAQQHLQFVAAWFQQMSKHQSEKLQEVLKLRGTVLRDQAQRRTMVTQQKAKSSVNHPGASSSTAAATSRGGGHHHQRRVPIKAATPLFDSPLFANTNNTSTSTSTTQGVNRPSAAQTRSVPANNQYYNPSAVPSNGGGGGYYSHSTAGAAGGYGLGYGDVGMRNRRQQQGPSSNGSATMQQQQQQQELEQRQIQRQTAQRAREARQAERQIGELGQLFGKMSTLIATQGEVVEQIEEDVEAAHVDIVAGEKELSKLYQLKKGNRPLIIKVYAILIFLICFMRLYKK